MKRFFWHRLRWMAVRQYLLPDITTVLDVGAGAGLVGDYLKTDRPDVLYRYIEPISSMEEQLEARFGRDANVRSLSYSADAVLALDVMEHQADDHHFMAELSKYSAVGGRVIVTVPALPAMWSSWDEALGHYRRYTKRMVRDVTIGLPLREIAVVYLFPELLPLAWIRKRTRRANSSVEFPMLGDRLNRLLVFVGRTSLYGQRLWPLGTSLLGVFERLPDD